MLDVLIPFESQVVSASWIFLLFFPIKMQQATAYQGLVLPPTKCCPSTNYPSELNALVAKGWNFSDGAVSPSAEATKTLQFVSSWRLRFNFRKRNLAVYFSWRVLKMEFLKGRLSLKRKKRGGLEPRALTFGHLRQVPEVRCPASWAKVERWGLWGWWCCRSPRRRPRTRLTTTLRKLRK